MPSELLSQSWMWGACSATTARILFQISDSDAFLSRLVARATDSEDGAGVVVVSGFGSGAGSDFSSGCCAGFVSGAVVIVGLLIGVLAS